MWEFTITINVLNKNYLDYILREIEFNKIKIISALIIKNDVSKLTIAVEIKYMQKLANILVDTISNIILLVHKKLFFEKNVELSKLTKNNKIVFLKSLIMFDADADKEEIKQEIILNRELNIDSFYYFKLNFLRQKWLDVLKIVNTNVYFSNNNNFMELLKFLVLSIDSSIPIINVYFKNKIYVILDNKNNEILSKNCKSNNTEIDLLSQIIELNPKVINIYCSNKFNSEIFKMLFYLYDKKINIIN